MERAALYMFFLYECVCECVFGLGFVHLCVFVCVRLGWVWVGMERAAVYMFFLYECVRV